MKRILFVALALLAALTLVVDSPFAASRPIAFVPTGSGVVKVAGGIEQSTASSVNLATSDVSGTLPIANGGTGRTSLAAGVLTSDGGAVGITPVGNPGLISSDGGTIGTTPVGAAGAYLRSDGTSWTSDLSGGWRTIFDLDFTTMGNVSLSGDGTYSIGGQSWTKVNSSRETTPLQLVNGTGMTVTPTNGLCGVGGNSCVAIYSPPITTYVSDFEPMWPIRITFWDATVFTGLNNQPKVRYGYLFDTTFFTSPSLNADGVVVSRGMVSSAQMIRVDLFQRQGVLGGNQCSFTLDTTNQITELFVPFAWWNGSAIVSYSSGSSASNFTNRQVRVPATHTISGSSFNAPIGFAGGISNMRFFIAFERDSTSAMNAVVKRMKVEYSRF